jgi:Secretion system C-terminal sorting domain
MTVIMKNLFLVCFLTHLSLEATYAQKALPTSLQPYSVNWHHTIVEGLHRMGYDMPTKSEQSADNASVSTRSANLRLDSTKTFYGYFNSDSTPLFRTYFTYPNATRKIEQNAQFDNGEWFNMNRSTIDTDPSGRIVGVLSEFFNIETQAYQFDSKLAAYPHGNSDTEVDSLFAWQWDTDNGDWKLLIAVRNVFNAQGQLIQNNSFLELFSQPTQFRDEYTYDNAGNNTLIQSYVVTGATAFLTGFREFSYVNGLPTQVVAYGMDNQFQPVPQSKIEYSYNNIGKEDTVRSFEWNFDVQNWLKTQEDFYRYDDQQRNIFKERRFGQAGEEEREQFEYHYQSDDLLSLEESFIWDGSGAYFLADRKYYYYSEATTAINDRPSMAESLAISPNPTTGVLWLGLQEPAQLRIFDISGIQVSNGTLSPDNTLNIVDLPSGIYIVTAQTATGFFTGKVVKE